MTANPQFLSDVKVYWAGYDLSGFANAAQLVEQAPLVDTPIFGDTGARRVAGPPQGSLGMAGYFDPETIDVQINAGIATGNNPVSVIPEGLTLGNTSMLFRAVVTEFMPFDAGVDKVGAFTFSALSDAGLRVVKGQLLHSGSETATDAETAVEVGAISATQEIYAALHVLSGTGTLDVILQSAATDSWGAPTNRITFTQATGVTSEWKSLAGAVTDAWWRASWTIATGPFSFVLTVGIL
jgi:hypothetical protein